MLVVPADSSIYCSMPSCILAASTMSTTCATSSSRAQLAALNGDMPSTVVSPNWSYQRGDVKRFDFVATWKDLAPDGFTKPVRRA